MLALVSVAFQVYIFALVLGISLPLLIFAMLLHPLRHFLHAIFRDPSIERFWVRVVFLALLVGSLSSTVGFSPDTTVTEDYIALIFSLADQVKAVLETAVLTMFCLFLPLLLSYTILYAGRERSERRELED